MMQKPNKQRSEIKAKLTHKNQPIKLNKLTKNGKGWDESLGGWNENNDKLEITWIELGQESITRDRSN